MFRKILSFLTALTLMTGISTTTIACGSNHSSKAPFGGFLINDTAKYAFHQNKSTQKIKNEIKQVKKLNRITYLETYQGLYSATDGVNFTINQTIPADVAINQIVDLNQHIYVGTANGLYTSADGIKFQSTNLPRAKASVPDPLSIQSIQLINSKIYVVANNFLYQSTDGQVFTQVAIPKNNNISLLTQINQTLYLAFNDLASHYCLAQSTDGQTFTINKTIVDASITNITKIDNTIYASTSRGLYQAKQDGQTFTRNKTSPYSNVRQIVKIRNIIYMATEEGLFESTDGITFVANYLGLYAGSSPKKIESINNIIYALTDKDGVFQSTDNGLSFKKTSSLPSYYGDDFADALTIIKQRVYVGFNSIDPSDPSLWESNAQGRDFTPDDSIPNGVAVTQIIPIGTTIYLITSKGLYQ